MGRFGVDCALKRRLRRSRQRRNEGRHVDLALYARMWGSRLSERRSHSDGARRAALAPVAKSTVAGPERRGGPRRPPFFLEGLNLCCGNPSRLSFGGGDVGLSKL